MTHRVTGLVATAALLQSLAAKHGLPAPVGLAGDLAILPLLDDALESLLASPPAGYVPDFDHLSEQLAEMLCKESANGTLLYFETEYFGGSGSQGAAVFQHGSCVFGPETGEIGPINRGLRLLGVTVRAPALDEFETLGLHRHRHTAYWLDVER